MQTEPEQWAEALWDHLLNKTFSRSQAIEAIQRAFEEQTRKLRDLALACVAIEANRWPENDDVQQALKTLSRRIVAYKPEATHD